MREPIPGVPEQPDPDIPMPANRTGTITESSGVQREADEAIVRRVADITKRERGERLAEIQQALSSEEITPEEALNQLTVLGKGESSAKGGRKNDQVIGPDQRGTGPYEDDPEGKPIGAGKGAGGRGEPKALNIKDHPAGVSPAALPAAETVVMPLEQRRNIFGMKYYGAIALRNLYRRFNTDKSSTAKVNPAAENVPNVLPSESRPAQKAVQPAASSSEKPLQESQPAPAEDLREKAVKEIAGYGINLTGTEETDEVIHSINAVITERNKQSGNAYKALWEEKNEETIAYVKGAVELIKERQTTVQQKT